MIQLKKISSKGITEALGKAERYRLLNEPQLAESICLDILEIEPDNKKGLVILLLAITDQFGSSESVGVNEARKLLQRLESDYERYYYDGIICERQATAILDKGSMSSNAMAYEWIADAMKRYEKAEAVRPAGNDDSILRWNTCARIVERHNLKPEREEYGEPPLE
jgi:hypothetical protein